MAACWTPSVDTFLGRVTKARILQAVGEAKGTVAAERIAHLKKGDMATEAEALLADASWLPEPLRTPGQPTQVETVAPDSTIAETLEDGGETTTADDDEARAATHAIAAE